MAGRLPLSKALNHQSCSFLSFVRELTVFVPDIKKHLRRVVTPGVGQDAEEGCSCVVAESIKQYDLLEAQTKQHQSNY